MRRGKWIALMGVAAMGLVGVGCGESAVTAEEPTEPIRVLLLTGGGFHDYETQTPLLQEAVDERMEVEWTVVHEGGGDAEHKMSVLQEEGWADGYDVVLHNVCFGFVEDAEFVERFVTEHNGVPAVAVHCSAMSYRMVETDAWQEFIGARVMWHEAARPFEVENVEPGHPVMEGFPETWQTPEEELYVPEETWPGLTPLATGYGVESEEDHPVIWTHEREGNRVFVTTLGHHNHMFEEELFQDLLSRGVQWAAGQLEK